MEIRPSPPKSWVKIQSGDKNTPGTAAVFLLIPRLSEVVI